MLNIYGSDSNGWFSDRLDLDVEKGPDHVFYFTARDSGNFGVEEHFGLISDCDTKKCKLQLARQDQVVV